MGVPLCATKRLFQYNNMMAYTLVPVSVPESITVYVCYCLVHPTAACHISTAINWWRTRGVSPINTGACKRERERERERERKREREREREREMFIVCTRGENTQHINAIHINSP